MESSGPTESPTSQVPSIAPESPLEIERNLGRWVRRYFNDVETDTLETDQLAEEVPRTPGEPAAPDPATNGEAAEKQNVPDVCLQGEEGEEEDQNLTSSLEESAAEETASSESRLAADPAVSGLLLKHAQKFFSSTAETALFAGGEPLPDAPQIPALIPIPSPDPGAGPFETSEKNWIQVIREFPRACGGGTLYGVRAFLRVPLAMFAAVRDVMSACGRGILWGARALFRVQLTMLAAVRKFLSACAVGVLYAIRAVLRVPLAIFAAARRLLSACERGILFAGRAVLRILLFTLAAARGLLSASAKSIHRGIRALAGIVNIACATTLQFASGCESGFYRAADKAIKLLFLTFATSRRLLPAFGKSIRRGILALANWLRPPSIRRFPVGTQLRRALLPVSVLIIVFTFLVSMLRTTTGAAANKSTEASSSRVPDANAGTAVALPIQAEAGSHRRVTDPEIYDILSNLSRFEIAPLRRQAAYGDSDAALLLAMVYETGHGLSQSCVKASHWVTVSAQAGNAAAEYNLGLRYLHGDGVPLNPAEGLTWLKKAAAQNYPDANTLLASSSTPLTGLPRSSPMVVSSFSSRKERAGAKPDSSRGFNDRTLARGYKQPPGK